MFFRYHKFWISITVILTILLFVWKSNVDDTDQQTVEYEKSARQVDNSYVVAIVQDIAKTNRDQGIRQDEYSVKQLLNSSLATTLAAENGFIQKARVQRVKTFCEKLDNKEADKKTMFMAKNVLIDDKHNILLLSIPKTGCTLWRWTIMKNLIPLNSNLAEGQKLSFVHETNFLKDKGFRIFSNLTRQEQDSLFDSYFNILTVRHPLDRLESSYIDKIVNYKEVNYAYKAEVVRLKLKNQGQPIGIKLDLNINVTFEDFLSYVLVRSNAHWANILKLAMPCQRHFNFISKTETLNMDIDYIIKSKLSGQGQVRSLNTNREPSQIKTHQGRHLPLFSQLRQPQVWITKLMKLYQTDMDMFGYSYAIENGNVFATCSMYYKGDICV